jgi:hypothetical protein
MVGAQFERSGRARMTLVSQPPKRSAKKSKTEGKAKQKKAALQEQIRHEQQMREIVQAANAVRPSGRLAATARSAPCVARAFSLPAQVKDMFEKFPALRTYKRSARNADVSLRYTTADALLAEEREFAFQLTKQNMELMFVRMPSSCQRTRMHAHASAGRRTSGGRLVTRRARAQVHALRGLGLERQDQAQGTGGRGWQARACGTPNPAPSRADR